MSRVRTASTDGSCRTTPVYSWHMPARCNICGSSDFTPGPGGRLAAEVPPKCAECGSLERHRIIRAIYLALPTALLQKSRALQFAGDISIDAQWFESFEVSTFQRFNHLNLEDIDRPDGSYDWVISNHVLEHVADDARAITEMLRITSPSGIVHINVPMPAYLLDTDDWGYPDPERHQHYRHYGGDFALRLNRLDRPFHCLQVVGRDAHTDTYDVLYLLSKNDESLSHIGQRLARRRFVVLRSR